MRAAARAVLVCAVVGVALSAGGTAAAVSGVAPVAGSGPVEGGTTVTVPAPTGMKFAQVWAGSSFSLASGVDGALYAWGGNNFGELGDGSNTDSDAPVRVQTPEGVTFAQISVDSFYAVAIGDDGHTYAWGDNQDGQLGDGTTTNRNVPVRVQEPAGVAFTQISAGNGFVVALGSDGNTYAWGKNPYGNLGTGDRKDSRVPLPVETPVGVAFTHVIAGTFFAAAMGADGNVYAWGRNDYGAIGDGTNQHRYAPVRVQTPAGVTFTRLSERSSPTVALGSDGNLYAWGFNRNGQLGNGSTENSNVPVRVQVPADVEFTQISPHGNFVAALGTDGRAYTWGMGQFGSLGNNDPDYADSTVPVPVDMPSGVTLTQVSAGYVHALALSSDGQIYAWGANTRGQLGDGTGVNRNFPAPTPAVKATAVTFDGIPGSGLVDNGDGTASVSTPAHAAGVVDVALQWTLAGVAQPPVVYPGAFTYVASVVAPTITDPSDQTVSVGGTASFIVHVTSEPTVVWEVSTGKGTTWRPIESDPAASVSADGLILTVAHAPADHDGFRYRAVASNSAGTATSGNATLTVQGPQGDEDLGEAAPVNAHGSTAGGVLAMTGAESLPLVLLGGVLFVVGAAAAVLALRARRHE